jgi:hypothetical protein
VSDSGQSVGGIQFYIGTATFPNGKSVGRSVWETEGEAMVTTDETGRFEVPTIASGPTLFALVNPLARPTRCPRFPPGMSVQAGKTLNLEIPMERTVLVRGTIRTENSLQPVAGAEIYVGQGVFVNGENVISDAQGNYEARVLPGKVYTQVISLPEPVRAKYEQAGEFWNKQTEVPAAAQEVDLPPILLAPTEVIKGTLIDRVGNRLTNSRVSAIRGNRRYGSAMTDAEGEFAVRLPRELAVDSFEVQLPDQTEIARPPKIMKYRPLVLCVESLPHSQAAPRQRN